MNGTIDFTKWGVEFSDTEVNFDKLEDDKKNFKATKWDFWDCKFIPKQVDFSCLIHCTRLYIVRSDIEEITAWPPRIREIHLRDCKNLKRIPEDPAQYKYLKKFHTSHIDLENWDIDLSQSEDVKCVGISLGFWEEEVDMSKIEHKKNIIGIGCTNSHFLQKTVDFSEFENLEAIYIERCDLEHITAWPPRLKKLTLKKCPNLLSIPLKAEQYRFLTYLELQDIFLPNWNIDLTEAFFLREIKLVNLLAYNPNQVAANPSLPKPTFKIPQNWVYCVALRRFRIEVMPDLAEIPVEFAHNFLIRIYIDDCPKIPNLNCLPEPLHECTQVSYWPAGGSEYDSGECILPEERKWTPEKTKFLDYIKLVIPKMPTQKKQEGFRNLVKKYSPEN